MRKTLLAMMFIFFAALPAHAQDKLPRGMSVLPMPVICMIGKINDDFHEEIKKDKFVVNSQYIIVDSDETQYLVEILVNEKGEVMILDTNLATTMTCNLSSGHNFRQVQKGT